MLPPAPPSPRPEYYTSEPNSPSSGRQERIVLRCVNAYVCACVFVYVTEVCDFMFIPVEVCLVRFHPLFQYFQIFLLSFNVFAKLILLPIINKDDQCVVNDVTQVTDNQY